MVRCITACVRCIRPICCYSNIVGFGSCSEYGGWCCSCFSPPDRPYAKRKHHNTHNCRRFHFWVIFDTVFTSLCLFKLRHKDISSFSVHKDERNTRPLHICCHNNDSYYLVRRRNSIYAWPDRVSRRRFGPTFLSICVLSLGSMRRILSSQSPATPPAEGKEKGRLVQRLLRQCLIH